MPRSTLPYTQYPPNTPPRPPLPFYVVFFDSEKITFLEIFDMYYMIFDIICLYLVKFDQYLINFSPPAAYESIPLGINRTLSYRIRSLVLLHLNPPQSH